MVGSYGFFLPHKGLLELIDAVAMLIKEGLPIELRMFNSEYPVNESRLLIDSANKKVSQLGLEKRVSINTSFLDDEVCVANLSELDLIVFLIRIPVNLLVAQYATLLRPKLLSQ